METSKNIVEQRKKTLKQEKRLTALTAVDFFPMTFWNRVLYVSLSPMVAFIGLSLFFPLLLNPIAFSLFILLMPLSGFVFLKAKKRNKSY